MVTKEDIVKQIKKGKRPTKAIILFYENDIKNRINYDILLEKVKEEFKYNLSYGSLVMGIKRHIKKESQSKVIEKIEVIKKVTPNQRSMTKKTKSNVVQKKDNKTWNFVDGPVSNETGKPTFDL